MSHVFVRGALVGSFGRERRDVGTRNLLMVCLADGEGVHLEQLAAAFGYTYDGLRRVRRLYKAEGGAAVMRRVNGGSTTKVTAGMRKRLEAAFEQGASIRQAWSSLGKRPSVSQTVVAGVRRQWLAARGRTSSPPLTPLPRGPVLALAPSGETTCPALAAAGDEVRAGANGPCVASDEPQVASTVSEVTAGEESREKLSSIPLADASGVQHLGTWLLVAMVARLGVYGMAAGAAGRRVKAQTLRIALDAVVAALAVGEKCVEGVRRLATSSAASLLMATGAPSPTWTRRTLGLLASEGGGMSLHLGAAGAYLRRAHAEASAAGPTFYVDNHLRPYTGKHVIRRGWRMQDKRVRPGTSDYYVHDEDGRPVMRLTAPSHGSLTDWLSPISGLLRLALGEGEAILLAFDRGGAFPEQLAQLRETGFEFVTYERKPYPRLPRTAFTEEVTLEGERLMLCDTRKNLGKARGRVRRIAVLMADGHQLNLLASSKRTAVELLEVMSGRWRQENGFKHGVERWGINQLDGRQVQAYSPDTIIPNPARRRLDRALRIARVREGEARVALSRLANDDAKRSAVERELKDAMAEQEQLEALRPSTPPRAALRDTELAGTLVHHTIEYKLVLDTIRIACANAESELATLLAPKLPRPAEAKKALANLFAAPGDVRVGKRSIDVCLSPAGTRPEQQAFAKLADAVNRLALSMPGDQLARPLRFRMHRN